MKAAREHDRPRRWIPVCLLTLLLAPATASAQCNNVMISAATTMGSDITVSAMVGHVDNPNCGVMSAVGPNVGCAGFAPGTLGGVSPWTQTLQAMAKTGDVGARSCVFNCTGCPQTVTIANSDGLPVELMEFSVDGREVDEHDSDEPVSGDG